MTNSQIAKGEKKIVNEGFNILEDFGVMDGDTDVLEIAKHLDSRDLATHMNLRKFQTKGLQAFVCWIHDL